MNKEQLLKQLNIIAKKDNLFLNCIFFENKDRYWCWLCKKKLVKGEIVEGKGTFELEMCFKCFLELHRGYKLNKDFIKLINEVNKYNIIEAL